jgi:hypothetical protein
MSMSKPSSDNSIYDEIKSLLPGQIYAHKPLYNILQRAFVNATNSLGRGEPYIQSFF